MRGPNLPFCAEEVETPLGRYKPWEIIGKAVTLVKNDDELYLTGNEVAAFLNLIINKDKYSLKEERKV